MALLTCALGPDNAGAVLLTALQHARTTVDATFYEVGEAYVWALRETAARGVAVRMVVDPHAAGMRERALELSRAGVQCRLAARQHGYTHAKLAVIDNVSIAVGSGNLNGRDAPYPTRHRPGPLAGTREWWVVASKVPTLARLVRTHILRAWRSGTPAIGMAVPAPDGAGPPIRPVHPEVAPFEIELSPRRLRLALGGSGVRTLEERLLSGVRRRALVMVPYVHAVAPAVAPLLGALTAHARRGIDVRLLLGEPPHTVSEAAMLGQLEVTTRVMDSAGSMHETTGHAKGLVCDDVALAGSANWSESGLSSSDEAAIAIAHTGAAEYYAAAFDRDWSVATPLASG